MAGPASSLFSCDTPVFAVYRTYEDHGADGQVLKAETFTTVEAWDGNGDAYVVGATTLVQAKTLPNFVGLYAASQVHSRPEKFRVPQQRPGGGR